MKKAEPASKKSSMKKAEPASKKSSMKKAEPALKKPRGSKFKHIREAAQFGTAADVKQFLDAGWPVDERDVPNIPGIPLKLCNTALSMACYHKKPVIVKLLLDAGADPNLTASSAPLVYAVTSKSKRVIDMVEMLLAAGADPDPPAYKGKTLIEWIANDTKLAHVREALVAAKTARAK